MKKNKYKLLIIDDLIKERLDVYERFFISDLFEIIKISDYSEFFKIKNQKFDAIILDVFLDQNGWDESKAQQVRQELKIKYSNVPIFIISNRWGDPGILAEMTVLTNLFGKNVADYLSYLEINNSVSEARNVNKIMNDQLRCRFLDKLRVVRQEATGIEKEKDDDITLLLLSDIQFKDPHTVKATNGLLGSIISSLSNNDIYPDFVVITGDISFSGCPLEFEFAHKELTKFTKRLWEGMPEEIRKQRIVLIPGNHDVNLRLAISSNISFSPNNKQIVIEGSLDSDENKHKVTCENLNNDYSKYGLLPFREFAFNLTGDRRWIESSNLNWIDQRFEHLGLSFINVNTVEKLNGSFPKKAFIDIDSFSYLGTNSDTFSIMLSHHGRDSSELEITSKESVEGSMLKTLNVQLWLWGHHHSYEMESLYRPARGDDFSESYSLQVPSSHQLAAPQDRKRGYVVLDLKRSDCKVTSAISRYFRTEVGKPPFVAKTDELLWE
jgi:hypothetical protein